jgi:hypothetical protein
VLRPPLELLWRDEVARVVEPPLRLRPEDRDWLEAELELLRRRERPEPARWSRGISARTSALTSRVSSESRNFAMRSSSRRMDRASCAVSRSPTSVENASSRL